MFIVCVGTDFWSCITLGTSLLIVIRLSVDTKPVGAIFYVNALTPSCLLFHCHIYFNTVCILYAHSPVWWTCNTLTCFKAILLGLLTKCTENFPLYFLAVTNETYLLWVWKLECRLQSQSLYRTLLSGFKITDGDLPELVSLFWSIQFATVHIYRNLTTLLCKVHLSRHPQPVCCVLIYSCSEIVLGLRFAETSIAHLMSRILYYSEFKYGGEQPIS